MSMFNKVKCEREKKRKNILFSLKKMHKLLSNSNNSIFSFLFFILKPEKIFFLIFFSFVGDFLDKHSDKFPYINSYS